MTALLIKLFLVFFEVGLFTFGGGYAALPLIQEQVVDINKWLTAEEMLDLISISQLTPGPIAVNTATFTGTRVAGLAGSIAATAGLAAPSIIIVLILSWLYYRYRKLRAVDALLTGIRPAAIAMIALAALGILSAVVLPGAKDLMSVTPEIIKEADLIAAGVFAAALAVIIKFKLDPIIVMLASGAAGFLLYKFI